MKAPIANFVQGRYGFEIRICPEQKQMGHLPTSRGTNLYEQILRSLKNENRRKGR